MRVGRVLRDASAVGRAVGPSLTPTQAAAPLSARTTPLTDQPGSRPASRQLLIPPSASALNARILIPRMKPRADEASNSVEISRPPKIIHFYV